MPASFSVLTFIALSQHNKAVKVYHLRSGLPPSITYKLGVEVDNMKPGYGVGLRLKLGDKARCPGDQPSPPRTVLLWSDYAD